MFCRPFWAGKLCIMKDQGLAPLSIIYRTFGAFPRTPIILNGQHSNRQSSVPSVNLSNVKKEMVKWDNKNDCGKLGRSHLPQSLFPDEEDYSSTMFLNLFQPSTDLKSLAEPLGTMTRALPCVRSSKAMPMLARVMAQRMVCSGQP